MKGEPSAIVCFSQLSQHTLHMSTPQHGMRYCTSCFQVGFSPSLHIGQSFPWKSLTGGHTGLAAAMISSIVDAMASKG